MRGDGSSLTQYKDVIRSVFDAYRSKLAAVYSAEDRWPEAPFWQRRN